MGQTRVLCPVEDCSWSHTLRHDTELIRTYLLDKFRSHYRRKHVEVPEPILVVED